MSIAAMKQALEALKYYAKSIPLYSPGTDAITALRAAIEAAEKQEPVAWMGEYNINDIRDHYTVVMRHKTDFSSMPDRVRPLYTTPQPAIPDGYVIVPIRMVEDICPCCCQWSEDHSQAMLAAAPKPENSHELS